MTKIRRFREAVMEYSIIPLILALILCIVNFIVFVFSKTGVMWLIYATAVAFALFSVWAVVFIVCLIIDRYEAHKDNKAYRKKYGNI